MYKSCWEENRGDTGVATDHTTVVWKEGEGHQRRLSKPTMAGSTPGGPHRRNLSQLDTRHPTWEGSQIQPPALVHFQFCAVLLQGT